MTSTFGVPSLSGSSYAMAVRPAVAVAAAADAVADAGHSVAVRPAPGSSTPSFCVDACCTNRTNTLWTNCELSRSV